MISGDRTRVVIPCVNSLKGLETSCVKSLTSKARTKAGIGPTTLIFMIFLGAKILWENLIFLN